MTNTILWWGIAILFMISISVNVFLFVIAISEIKKQSPKTALIVINSLNSADIFHVSMDGKKVFERLGFSRALNKEEIKHIYEQTKKEKTP